MPLSCYMGLINWYSLKSTGAIWEWTPEPTDWWVPSQKRFMITSFGCCGDFSQNWHAQHGKISLIGICLIWGWGLKRRPGWLGALILGRMRESFNNYFVFLMPFVMQWVINSVMILDKIFCKTTNYKLENLLWHLHHNKIPSYTINLRELRHMIRKNSGFKHCIRTLHGF